MFKRKKENHFDKLRFYQVFYQFRKPANDEPSNASKLDDRQFKNLYESTVKASNRIIGEQSYLYPDGVGGNLDPNEAIRGSRQRQVAAMYMEKARKAMDAAFVEAMERFFPKEDAKLIQSAIKHNARHPDYLEFVQDNAEAEIGLSPKQEAGLAIVPDLTKKKVKEVSDNPDKLAKNKLFQKIAIPYFHVMGEINYERNKAKEYAKTEEKLRKKITFRNIAAGRKQR